MTTQRILIVDEVPVQEVLSSYLRRARPYLGEGTAC